MKNPKPDNQLMLEFKKGSESAFDELYKKYRSGIFKYIYFEFIHNKEQAEDVTMQVFGKVYINKSKYKFSHEFSTWLYRIARNESINFIKKMKKQNDVFSNNFDMDQFVDSDHQAANFENYELINILLSKLTPSQREVILLRGRDEFTYEQISQINKTTVNTLKSHYRRGMKILAKIILRNKEDSVERRY